MSRKALEKSGPFSHLSKHNASRELAPFQHVLMVAGFHRALPSTSLDKRNIYLFFDYMIGILKVGYHAKK